MTNIPVPSLAALCVGQDGSRRGEVPRRSWKSKPGRMKAQKSLCAVKTAEVLPEFRWLDYDTESPSVIYERQATRPGSLSVERGSCGQLLLFVFSLCHATRLPS